MIKNTLLKFVIVIPLCFSLKAVAESKGCNNLIVGGDHNWPPYSEFSKGTYHGSSWASVRKIFNKLSIKYTKFPENRSRDHQIKLLYENKIDAFITHTTSKHDKFLTITRPYEAERIALYMNAKKRFPFSVIYSIQGKKGLINTGLNLGEIQETFAKYYLDIRRLSSNKKILQHLLDKKVDYAVWKEEEGDKLIKSTGNEELILKAKNPLNRQFISIAFSEKSGCSKAVTKINALIVEDIKKKSERKQMELLPHN